MDILEGIIGRFRKAEKQPKPISNVLEGRSTPRVWTSAHFLEYLMALGRDRNFLLSLEQYPDLIELSEDTHESLEEMRKRTTNGHEHYSVIGYASLLRSINVPVPSKGLPGQISPQIRSEAHSAAKGTGIDRIIGNIHTHPEEGHLSFSIADLYGMVVRGSTDFVEAVLGSEDNLFVFRTRGTSSTGFDGNLLTHDGFCRFWYEQNGYRYFGAGEGGERAQKVKQDAPSIWELNLKVAKKHNLVFYEGEIKQDLVKVFPTAQAK